MKIKKQNNSSVAVAENYFYYKQNDNMYKRYRALNYFFMKQKE